MCICSGWEENGCWGERVYMCRYRNVYTVSRKSSPEWDYPWRHRRHHGVWEIHIDYPRDE